MVSYYDNEPSFDGEYLNGKNGMEKQKNMVNFIEYIRRWIFKWPKN